jgi:AcrR family transcriptional regulator
MATAARHRPAKRSEARERLLAAASKLFYAEGINSVGVDRIVSESHVTLATFYRHFPSKQDLVVAYLQRTHDSIADRTTALTDHAQGAELVRAIADEVSSQLGQPGFRGCAFINAASEFEDPQSPVRRVVAEHRRWYYELVRRAFAEAGHQRPGNAARHFVMVRDGAMTAGYLDGVTVARRTLSRGIEAAVGGVPLAAADEDEEGSAPPEASPAV